MSELRCSKLKDVVVLIKKFKELKMIIKDCDRDKNVRIAKIHKNDKDDKIPKKDEQIKNLEEKLNIVKDKYVILQKKLYDVVETLQKCECCTDSEYYCDKGKKCLNVDINDKMWETMDELHNDLNDFDNQIENLLVIETELCFLKINKLKKIKFFDF